MRAGLAIAIVACALSTGGCGSAGAVGTGDNERSAAQGASAPIPTNVGPVPGAASAPGITPAHATNPYANDADALQNGWRLFNWYNCSGCHGGHAGGGMGPSLRDPVWLYGDRDDQIFDSIAQGRSNGMPSWGSKIPEDQIWQLVAYIKSMGTPAEPEPPVEPADEMVGGPSPVAKGPQTP